MTKEEFFHCFLRYQTIVQLGSVSNIIGVDVLGNGPRKAFSIFFKIKRALKVRFLMRAKLLGQFFLRRSTDDSEGAAA